MEYLKTLDTSLFLLLNGWHNPFFDKFFFYATEFLYWIPLYILLIVLVIRTFRWKSILLIIGLALMITVSDQAANVSKNTAQRLRPTHESQLEQRVHTVNGYKGGTFGFYSAHASTNFAVALFLILFLHKHYRWITPVLLVYASIMAYSRIYLGVHYPGDILAGTAIGLFLGWLFWKLLNLIPAVRGAT